MSIEINNDLVGESGLDVYDVYLAGTCNNSMWRHQLIPLLDQQINYVDPTTNEWNHDIELYMRKIKDQCHYILYVITSEMKGVLAIANVVDLAHKYPERILFCYLKDGFDQEQIMSLEEVKFLLEELNVKTFSTLIEVASYLNNTK